MCSHARARTVRPYRGAERERELPKVCLQLLGDGRHGRSRCQERHDGGVDGTQVGQDFRYGAVGRRRILGRVPLREPPGAVGRTIGAARKKKGHAPHARAATGQAGPGRPPEWTPHACVPPRSTGSTAARGLSHAPPGPTGRRARAARARPSCVPVWLAEQPRPPSLPVPRHAPRPCPPVHGRRA